MVAAGLMAAGGVAASPAAQSATVLGPVPPPVPQAAITGPSLVQERGERGCISIRIDSIGRIRENCDTAYVQFDSGGGWKVRQNQRPTCVCAHERMMCRWRRATQRRSAWRRRPPPRHICGAAWTTLPSTRTWRTSPQRKSRCIACLAFCLLYVSFSYCIAIRTALTA
jgi:hypothetical protein